MAFARDARSVVAAVLVFVSTAVLVWFGNGLEPVWPLFWFAPLPVLVYALHGSWRSTGVLAALSWLAGCLNLWQYMRSLQMPGWVWLLIFSTVALVFAASVLLFRALVRAGAPWAALAAFPAAWVSFEYVRNLTTAHGTAGSIAYSQLDFLPFLQVAAVTGPWGMSFLLFLFPAALASGLYLRRTHPKQALGIVCGGTGAVLLALVFGAVRLALPLPQHPVKVGLIASDQAAYGPVARAGAPTEQLLREYAREAEGLASRGARVVVIPEKVGVVADTEIEAVDAIFQGFADRTGTTAVVGLIQQSGEYAYNGARVYRPRAAVLTYDKHHLLPPFESDLKPGTAITLLSGDSTTWGVAICKDMDFTQLSRRYGNARAGLMLVPAWDFRLDRRWHGHIAVMRGVEDGFSVARSSKDGNLTVSDNRGRILAETRSDAAPFATLLVDAPAVAVVTPYLLFGDWCAWLSLGTLALALFHLYRRTRAR